jgi:pimeloyl-ACP methyl ester carboxylesterase
MVRFSTAAIFLLSFAVVLIGIWLWTPDKSRAALEAKYLHRPSDMLDVSGVRLHVRDSGPKDAPAIIMLHGFGSSLQTWEPWAHALDEDYRIIRFDLPGAGLSGSDPGRNYTDTRTMEILAALMDRLGIASAVLIGNSIGGRIAWSFAVRYPERVTKLVLIAPDGFASQGIVYGHAPVVSAMAKLMRYVLPKPFIRMNLRAAYGSPDAVTDRTVDRYYDLMLGPGVRDAMISRMEQTVLEDPRPLLRSIQVPALLLWGEKDEMIPASNAADYARELPNSTLVLFPKLGHVPQEESPSETLSPVRSFLAHQ